MRRRESEKESKREGMRGERMISREGETDRETGRMTERDECVQVKEPNIHAELNT